MRADARTDAQHRRTRCGLEGEIGTLGDLLEDPLSNDQHEERERDIMPRKRPIGVRLPPVGEPDDVPGEAGEECELNEENDGYCTVQKCHLLSQKRKSWSASIAR